MTHIYKIMGRDEWAAAQAAGVYDGSAHDRRDGFIHFSTAEQAAETAAKHFAGRNDLLLLTIEMAGFGEALKWEPSRGGALFPHLYAPLPLDAVIAMRELPLGADGAHIFPPA
ncbi:DUF952 domain-containing protein [Sphingoaurantiacus capsulatus]|uniref:DUF952 domain-containing protein n=1 Tax=Sphingoaurantiacus capsulatus TaxID=1771310 RepID=A0ABV7X682_9SPHN